MIELTDYFNQILITPGTFATYFCITKDYLINFNVYYKTEYEQILKSNGFSTQNINEKLVKIGNFIILISKVLFYMSCYVILNIIDFILLMYIGFMLMKKICTFFIKELMKRHLYIEHQPRLGISFNFRFKFYYSLTFTNSIHSFILFGPLFRLFTYFNYDMKPSKKGKLILISIARKVLFLIKIIPLLLIPIIIIYDIYYYSWVVTKIFYYLIPFMIYNLWKRHSDFLLYYNILFVL